MKVSLVHSSNCPNIPGCTGGSGSTLRHCEAGPAWAARAMSSSGAFAATQAQIRREMALVMSIVTSRFSSASSCEPESDSTCIVPQVINPTTKMTVATVPTMVQMAFSSNRDSEAFPVPPDLASVADVAESGAGFCALSSGFGSGVPVLSLMGADPVPRHMIYEIDIGIIAENCQII